MSNLADFSFHNSFHQDSADSLIYATEIPCKRLDGLLTENEQKHFDQYSYPKRRDEWLAGRIAAKTATIKLLQMQKIDLQFSQFEVRNRDDGRPYLTMPSKVEEQVDISISHSKEYAIAMVSKNGCGIDIQKKSKTLEKVENRFCEPDELRLLQKSCSRDRLILLTKLWAAKEAVKKATSISGTMPGFTELRLFNIIKKDSAVRFQFQVRQPIAEMPTTCETIVYSFADYAIAICTINDIPSVIWERKNA